MFSYIAEHTYVILVILAHNICFVTIIY